MAINVGDAEVTVAADGAAFLAEMKAIARRAEKNFTKSGDKMGKNFAKALVGGMTKAASATSTFGTAAAAVGPALLAIGAAMSAAASAAVQLTAAIGPPLAAAMSVTTGAMLAMAQGMAFGKMAFKDLSKAITDDKAFAKLTGSSRSLVKEIRSLKKPMEEVRAAVRKGLFPDLEKSIDRLGKAYMPLLKTAALQTGNALGDLATEGTKMLTSGPWRADFATLTKANAGNLRLMGGIFFDLLDVIRNLLVTSAPLTKRFLEWGSAQADSLKKTTESGRALGDLAAWFKKAGDMAATWGGILGNISHALWNTFSIANAGQPADLMLTKLTAITQKFEDWTNSAEGTSSISEWFKNGSDNLAAMGRIIDTVSAGLSKIGSGAKLAPLLDKINALVVPPLLEFLENTSASGALDSFIEAMGKAAEIFADISGTYGSLQSFSDTLFWVLDKFQWIITNVPGMNVILGTFMTVMGGWKALNLLGLGGALKYMATTMLALTGATTANTASLAINSAAFMLSNTTLGIWLGLKALEIVAWWNSTAAATAFGAALKIAMGPIGWIILAITAIIGALVLLYKKNATFRKFIDETWAKIKVAIAAVVDWLMNTAWPIIKQVWDKIVEGAQTLWGWMQSAWDKIKGAISAVVDWLINTAWPIIQQVWGFISAAIGVAWSIIKPIFDAIVGVIQNVLVPIFQWLWSVVKVAFQIIGVIIATAWFAMSAVFDAIKGGIGWVADKFEMLKVGIGVAWDWISQKLAAAWAWIDANVFVYIRAGVDWLKEKFERFKIGMGIIWDWIKSKLYAAWQWIDVNVWSPLKAGLGYLKAKFDIVRDGIGRAWDLVKSKLKAGWDWISANVFAPLKTGLDSLKSKFETVKTGIGKVWDGLKEIAKAPIKFIIETVLNKGLIGGFNWLSKKVGGPKVDNIPLPPGFKSGGVLPGYTPGRDVHEFYSRTGGRLSLSGGEPIMRPEFGRVVGKGWVDKMNRAARTGGTGAVRKALGFASGGVFPGGHQSFAGGGILGWIKEQASGIFDWVSDKASAVFKAVTNPKKFFEDRVTAMPGYSTLAKVGEYGKSTAIKGIGVVVDKVKSLWESFKKAFDTSGVGGVSATTLEAMRTNGTGYKAMTAWLKAHVPGTTVTSDYRPGAYTAIGNPSRHGMGRALDIVPPGRTTFTKILEGIGQKNINQLFASQMGISNQIVNGRRITLDSTTFGDHFNHVHWGMNRGGMIPSFDNGGILRPGLNLVRNSTGGRERLSPSGSGGTVVNVQMTVSVDDLAKMSVIEDFMDMLDKARVTSRQTQRSGTVSA